MEVMMVRQGNDDDRLDALERAFVALRAELTAEMDRRFDRVDSRLDRIENRMEDGMQSLQQTIIKLQQTMIVVGASLVGTLAAALIAVLAAGA
jgi:hypothetical protein